MGWKSTIAWVTLLLSAPEVVLSSSAYAQEAIDQNTLAPSKDPTRTANGLAQRPPMGWNSWNKFGCKVDEKTVRAVADAMAGEMKNAGYEYVVVDDCWHGSRDKDGFITADPERFPSGMKALADYVHRKGLKFGIYSDAGRKTCGGRPGSQGFEYQDALIYARWGVDYLKYDWCNTGTRNAEEAYALMSDALRSTGRNVVLSICEWGNNRPWDWGKKIGNLWRTTGDITDKWEGRHGHSWGIMSIVDMNEPLWPHAGPGHWNDPDMLEVGNGGLNETEYRTHFSLWAMMAAPLIAGNDVTAMDEATRAILLNRDVIAVDQDTLGVQGRRVWKDGDREIWVKPLTAGARAVLLINRGTQPIEIAARWEQLGLPDRLPATVRDLWARRDVGTRRGTIAATVAPHGAAMFRVQP